MKKIGLFLIILIIIIGGFIYLGLNLIPKEKSESPTLFSKEDYKIEKENNNKFIVVDKVGLKCKVPEGWDIKIEGDDVPKSEYWVNLLSPDAVVKDNIIDEGCIAEILVVRSKETAESIRDNIVLLKNENGELESLKDDYFMAEKFEIVNINGFSALKTTSQENNTIGQNINIEIPIKDSYINFNIAYSMTNKKTCLPIWEDFLENVEIN